MRRLLMFALVLVAAGGGAMVASAAVSRQDAPRSLTPEQLRPLPGAARVVVSAADPGGAPDWALRMTDTAGGFACARLGRLTPDGFHPGPRVVGPPARETSDAEGSCGEFPADGGVIIVDRFGAQDGEDARSVVSGRVSEAGRTVAVTADGLRRTATLGRQGYFLQVLPGLIDPASVTVTSVAADGQETRRGLGDGP